MRLNDYQRMAGNTAVYPQAGTGSLVAVNYVLVGLGGETGEVLDKHKKTLRDGAPPSTIDSEIGDVLWYLAQYCTERGINLNDVARINLHKLGARAASGTLHGTGDDR